MPIFEQNYSEWGGKLRSTGFRWTPITSVGIRQTFKKKRFLLFFLFCLIPVIVFGAMIVIKAVAPQNIPIELEFWKVGSSFFSSFLQVQTFFVWILTIWVGANLINDDFRTNALQLYLSRPLTSFDYIAGKFSIVAFFLLAITAAPALLLFLMRVLMIPDAKWFAQNFYLVFSIIGYSLVMTVAFTLLILFLSAVSKNARFSGIAFILATFFSAAIAGAFYGITRAKVFAHIAFYQNVISLESLFFGIEQSQIDDDLAKMMNPWISLTVLIVLSIIFYSIIRKKVGKTEVVQ